MHLEVASKVKNLDSKKVTHMNYLQDFQSFNESEGFRVEKASFDYELSMIMLKYFYQKKELIDQLIYLSVNERNEIKKYYGKRLPLNFPGPEKHCLISAVLDSLVDTNFAPYFDDADLVFPSKSSPRDKVFHCKVANREITSTWKDLGDWLAEDDDIIEGWLEFDGLDVEAFLHKKRGTIKGKEFGF